MFFKNIEYDDVHMLPELYEDFLSKQNKMKKKECGQYYTPEDVCDTITNLFYDLYKEGSNVADVCCGCGNLIVNILKDEVRRNKILESSNVYLYDIDEDAIQITLLRIKEVLGESNYESFKSRIHVRTKDFLNDEVTLPDNVIVVSNPPYGKVVNDKYVDYKTYNIKNYYALFTEKIVEQSKYSILIIPQNFVGLKKYEALRDVLKRFGGDIYCFDNVPATIFQGKKKGIFNTNTANSVRTSFLVVDKDRRGYRITPLLRFKSSEREFMFRNLKEYLSNKLYHDERWYKIPKFLEDFMFSWMNNPIRVKDVLEYDDNRKNPEYKINIPTTLRYYISAVHKDVTRSSQIQIYAKDESWFKSLYLCLNSSIFYLWWRMIDGEITLKEHDLLNFPIIKCENCDDLFQELISSENKYVTFKKNAGKINENIKFPEECRIKINSYLNCPEEIIKIHKNSLF